MSKIIKKMSEVRQYWKALMASPRNTISRGSAQIFRILSWARGENWRQSDRKNKKSSKK